MNNEARQAILGSIRAHLAASVAFDKLEVAAKATLQRGQVSAGSGSDRVQFAHKDRVEVFKRNVEAISAHCIIAQSDADIARALTQIISALQKTPLRAQRIAISDNADVERLLYQTDLEIEELAIAPNAHDIFRFDVGITSAQAAIAETGTLVLDSTRERHRLVSLVPPVHIAIVAASTIYETLDAALAFIRREKEISPAVTFITGPSRTADIELTLTVGVHGPQALYVIVNGSK